MCKGSVVIKHRQKEAALDSNSLPPSIHHAFVVIIACLDQMGGDLAGTLRTGAGAGDLWLGVLCRQQLARSDALEPVCRDLLQFRREFGATWKQNFWFKVTKLQGFKIAQFFLIESK